MKNNKTLTVIKIIALCCLCIAVFVWITDARKLAGYEKIREASKKEISNISDMEAEEYFKTIEVEFDYRTKDNYLDSKCKLFCNYMTFIVTFEEAFDELTVRDKAAQIVKYDS